MDVENANCKQRVSECTDMEICPISRPLKVHHEITGLEKLVEELHAIFSSDHVNVHDVQKLMLGYKSDPKDWRKYAKFDRFRYTRNLVDAGNGAFNIMILCWGAEHASPIHDHADSHCFMKMLSGSLEEVRFLATGDSFQTISFSFRVGRSTVGSIVLDVCKEIWNTLQPIYMPTPTEDIWKQSEAGYREIWKFPNCVGSIDGKHIEIKCPPNSGSNFYCYKNFFSIVLLAIVDPYYKFIVVDIGSCGHLSDSGIFENSAFYQEFIVGRTLLPPKPLPGTTEPVPHVLIGDEGFGLKPFLMRPFSREAVLTNERKRNFNKRLCRARRVVENAFGIMAEKWRVFQRPIDCSLDTIDNIVKATCCLHNYLRTKEGRFSPAREAVTPMAMTTIRPVEVNESDNSAFETRDKFVSYFMNN